MPRVGDREFSYSKAGRAKAKAYAKRTGKDVRKTPSGRAAPTSRRKKKKGAKL